MVERHIDARLWAQDGLHRRGLVSGVVDGILGGGDDDSTTQQKGGSNDASNNPPAKGDAQTTTSTDGGLLGGVTSVVGGVTSVVGGATSAIGSAISSALPTTTATSASATSSAAASATSSSATSTSSSLSSSSSSSSSTTSSTAAPTSTASVASTYTSTISGVQTTVTVQSAAAESSSAAPADPPKAFLQNRPLETGVFTVVGIAALAIIVFLVTCAMRQSRRRKRDREFAEAVSFDPGAMDRYGATLDAEKGHGASLERWNSSSSGHGRSDAHTLPTPMSAGGVGQEHFFGQGQGFGHPGAFLGAQPFMAHDAGHGYPQPPPPQQYAPPSSMLTSPITDESRGAAAGVARSTSGHTNESGMTMPVAAPLPERFGQDAFPNPHAPRPGEFARNESAEESTLAIPRHLTVANE